MANNKLKIAARKIDEKQLERQMMELMSRYNNQGEPSSRAWAVSSFLLFKAAKRLERYSIILLAVGAILAAGMILVGLVLAYYAGLIP